MRRNFTLAILLLFMGFTAQAQLPDGSIAPDFTVTDLDGNEWNLYDILDQGKTVIIDAYATWCAPCWSYHQGGTLKDAWNQYGPNGTDELFVFGIESDPNTTIADIEGTGTNTQGNWLTGVPYPMVDYGAFNQLYEIAYFPTIYMICPSRNVYEIGQPNLANLYAGIDTCPEAFGVNNAALFPQEDLGGKFCGSSTINPQVTFQNFGSDTITSAEFSLSLNGEVAQTQSWTGSIATYQIADISFDEFTVTDNTDIEVSISSVNGNADEDTSNDIIQASALLGPTFDFEIITLEITTDNYAYETYWEIIDENGVAYHTGGNIGIFNAQVTIDPDAYAANSTQSFELALPTNGCYSLRVYDQYGDGICCAYGNGSYKIFDDEGTQLISGGAFEYLVEEPFELSGANEVNNNASILLYQGERGEFCGALSFEPSVIVQNSGANAISTLTVDLLNNGEVLQSMDWEGTLETGGVATILFEEITLLDDSGLSFEITAVNGEEDAYDYKNAYGVALNRVPLADTEEITVEIQTDAYGYETYWQITNFIGVVIASGGNENVGPNGGGARVAAAGDPGAYGNNVLISETVTVPANGCYDFLIVDDWGDGICCTYGNGFYQLKNAAGEIVFDGNNVGLARVQAFEVDASTATKELTAVNQLSLFPNPTSDLLTVTFDLTESMPLTIDVFNALGQRIQTVAAQNFTAGSHTLEVDASAMPGGLYFINLRNADKVVTKRFAVSK